MINWQVRLSGDKHDLSDLIKYIKSERITIKQIDDFFYLYCKDFVSEDPNFIHQESERIIGQINGAAILFFGPKNFTPFGFDFITHLKPDGSKHSYGFLSSTINVRSRVIAEVTVIDSEGNEVQQESLSNSLTEWVTISLDNKDVADALHFFRQPRWFNLYKIYEIIRDDMNGEDLLLRSNFVPKKDIKRFTQSAQSRELLGEEARHASRKYRPPEVPMGIDEAMSLIKQLFTNWAYSKK